MAVYTTTLMEFSSTLAMGSIGERQQALIEWLFNDDLGLNPELLKEFEQGFVKTYFFTEIGFETPYLFRDRFQALIFRKSPYYNRLYDLNNILNNWNPLEDEIEYHDEDIQNRQRINEHDRMEKLGREDKETEYMENDGESITQSTSGREGELTGKEDKSENGEVTVEEQSTGNTHQERNGGTNNTLQNQEASSDYPQGNVPTSSDYYTAGKYTAEKNGTATEETTTGEEGTTGKKTEGHNNLSQSDNSSTSMEKINSHDENTVNNQSSREKSNELKSLLEEILSMTEREGGEIKRRKHGRMSRRPVPELIEALKNGYIHVPGIMVKDCEPLFMSIW